MKAIRKVKRESKRESERSEYIKSGSEVRVRGVGH